MYCPRCGTPNTDTTKYCRQCGLPMMPVTGYVASGGTGTLTPPPQSQPVQGLAEGMTPKQRLVLTILFLVMSPAICGVLGAATGLRMIFGPLAGISAVLMQLAIVWAVFRYRAQVQYTKLMGQQMQWQAPIPPAYQTPPLPYPQQQPIPNPTSQPVSRVPMYQSPAASPPQTNPLGGSKGSVTEEETRQLPEQRH